MFSMAYFERCLIMLCSSKTEADCLRLNLFGTTESMLESIKYDIKIGDMGLLLNYNRDELIGIFEATSEPDHNLDSNAWGGRYPTQVRVKLIGEIQRIKSATSILEKVGVKMKWRTNLKAKTPQFVVYDQEIAKKIVAHFPKQISIKDKSTHAEARTTIFQDIEFADEGFEGIIGLDEVKNFIKKRMVAPLVDLESAQEYYLRLGGGLLLYGPPGTGKTLIAQATAGEIDAQFVELSPSIIRGFPGDPEKRIEKMFQNLLNVPRAVVFLDEADALLATRDNQTSTVMQRITPVLLAQFSKLSRYRFKPILVMAATNMPWGIDSAFRRPGRLDKSLYVGLPDLNDRINLLIHFLKKRGKHIALNLSEKENNLHELARELEGYSGADIEQIVDEAAHNAFNQKEDITYQIIKEIIKDWQESVSKEQIRKYEEWGKKCQPNLKRKETMK